MTRQWDYYPVTATEAADLTSSPDHRVWSAQWVLGLPETGEPAFVIVAAAGGLAVHTPIATALVADDKDPFPPPPPPPPSASMQAFVSATASFLQGGAPRSLDEDDAAA